MKIIIRTGEEAKPITIRIPTRGLITGLGPIALATGSAHVSGIEKKLTYRQARTLCRALVKSRKVLNGEPLVAVYSSGEEQLSIYL